MSEQEHETCKALVKATERVRQLEAFVPADRLLRVWRDPDSGLVTLALGYPNGEMRRITMLASVADELGLAW